MSKQPSQLERDLIRGMKQLRDKVKKQTGKMDRARGPMRFRCGISPDGKPWMLRDPKGAWVSYVAYEIGVAATQINHQKGNNEQQD